MRTRAAVIYEMEKPQPYAETRPLVIEEVELEPPGQGEALVEIVSAGLCHSDLSTINGTIPRQLPMILGHEASGIVREVGPGVVSVKPDDHVVFPSCPLAVIVSTVRLADQPCVKMEPKPTTPVRCWMEGCVFVSRADSPSFITWGSQPTHSTPWRHRSR